jgi:hypothetical protein
MEKVAGRPGELSERLLDLVDWPEPHLRAVAITLLIKALDLPGEEMALMEWMVASDAAAVMIDPAAATEARGHLRHRLARRLEDLAAEMEEPVLTRVLRDHLSAQIERWATRAVDDADNRRRAERFLAWADRPGQLEAAQRRGLFLGMDTDEFRRLADLRVREPVTPETAVGLWVQVDEWLRMADERLGEGVLKSWEAAGYHSDLRRNLP